MHARFKPGLINMGVGHDKLIEDFLTGEMSNIVLQIQDTRQSISLIKTDNLSKCVISCS